MLVGVGAGRGTGGRAADDEGAGDHGQDDGGGREDAAFTDVHDLVPSIAPDGAPSQHRPGGGSG